MWWWGAPASSGVRWSMSCVRAGRDVVIYDRAGSQAAVDERHGRGAALDVRGDVRDAGVVMTTFRGADEVYDFAGELGTSELDDDIPEAITTNVLRAAIPFEAAIRQACRGLSTRRSRRVAEHVLDHEVGGRAVRRALQSAGRDPVLLVRHYNVFGPTQSLYPIRKIIPMFAAWACGRPSRCSATATRCSTSSTRPTSPTSPSSSSPRSTPTRSSSAGAAWPHGQPGRPRGERGHRQPRWRRHLPMRRGEDESSTLVADLEVLSSSSATLLHRPRDEPRVTIDWYRRLPLPRSTTPLTAFCLTRATSWSSWRTPTTRCWGRRHLSKLAQDRLEGHRAARVRRSDPRGREALARAARGLRRILPAARRPPGDGRPAARTAQGQPPPGTADDGIVPSVDRHDVVMFHWSGDMHHSHQAVARAVEIATRPFRRRRDATCSRWRPRPTRPSTRPRADHWVVLDERSCDERSRRWPLPLRARPGRRPADLLRELGHRGTTIGVDTREAFVVARQDR